MILSTVTLEPPPEYGLDCLTRAIFARQRSSTSTLNKFGSLRVHEKSVRPWIKLLRGENPSASPNYLKSNGCPNQGDDDPALRERARASERERERKREPVCVCVCVRERERERERECV